MKIIKLSAEWCNPCKGMIPIINCFKEKYSDIEIENVDIEDDVNDYCSEYKIKGVPTFIIINDDGSLKKVHTGTLDVSKLEELCGLI